jgi:hypothetical protein
VLEVMQSSRSRRQGWQMEVGIHGEGPRKQGDGDSQVSSNPRPAIPRPAKGTAATQQLWPNQAYNET